ncbi:ead/Ea22-like family protein [Salmonella enterica]|nr:ead/Ea22-like family protein [Salmonella enterica]
MNIDKQALREAAEKADSGEWSYEEFNRLDLPGGAHIRINGRAAVYCLNKATGGIEQSRAMLAHIAAFSPKVALALLDELEHYKSREERVTKLVLDNSTSWDVLYEKLEAAEKRIAEQREYYEGVIADGSKRIAELEARTVVVKQFDDFQIVHYGATEDYAKGYIDCQSNYNKAIYAAGIKVKGE